MHSPNSRDVRHILLGHRAGLLSCGLWLWLPPDSPFSTYPIATVRLAIVISVAR